MTDYVPFAQREEQPSPHDLRVPTRDPWWVWVIACTPLAVLAALLRFGNASELFNVLAFAAVVAATIVVSVRLARRDEAASHWLAVVPAAFLLVRASRRAAEPHRGNPLSPLLLHLVLALGLGYFVVLFLMGMLGSMLRYL